MTAIAERTETGRPKRPEIIYKAVAITERQTLPTPEELAIINRYTKRPHVAEEVYVSECDLCNDQKDRSFEWFPVDVLQDFAATLPGKSLLAGHQHGSLPMGLWFDAAVAPDTVKGKPARVVRGKSYMVKTHQNEHDRAQLDGGVYRYASIGFHAEDLICDICGGSWFELAACPHYAGVTYEIDGKQELATAHYTRSDEYPAEAVEGSIVYLGCQFDAEFKAVEGQKSFGGVREPRERMVEPVVEVEGEKPYPGEHSCRLRDPGDCSEFRRENDAREHEGKKYDVIFGHLKGEDAWVDQAFRYDKDVWTAEAAGSHCESHDGSFEAASGDAAPAPETAADDMLAAATTEELRAMLAMARDGAKVGRVLSAANESKLRQARELIDQGAAMIAEVLAAVEQTQTEAAGTTTAKAADSDPIRWNPALPKSFDVASAQLPAQQLLYDWAKDYLKVEICDVHESGTGVPAARMGSFLAALDEVLQSWHVDALRNITYEGKEAPPEYATIRLKANLSREFMVGGVRFLAHNDLQSRLVLSVSPDWSGLSVTAYCVHGDLGPATKFIADVWAHAAQLNFLKGESFALSGQFLERGGEVWGDLFLDATNEKPLRRAIEKLNAEGAALEPRGLLLMGPPGTGKTLAGRVMMNEARDATFIWVSARDFWRSGAFGGIAYAFDLARECAPTVLFVEDVDNWLGGAEVDLLKTEMDGIKRSRGLVTALTTNYPERFPKALIDRPGRFHDVLRFDLPSKEVRRRMLAAWLPTETEATVIARCAEETAGLSGAHLRELVRFADTLRAEDNLTIAASLDLALAKIRAQRELIDAEQRGKCAYRPSVAFLMIAGRQQTARPQMIDAFPGAPSAENTPGGLNASLAREALEQSLQATGLPITPDEILGSSGGAATAANEDANA